MTHKCLRDVYWGSGTNGHGAPTVTTGNRFEFQGMLGCFALVWLRPVQGVSSQNRRKPRSACCKASPALLTSASSAPASLASLPRHLPSPICVLRGLSGWLPPLSGLQRRGLQKSWVQPGFRAWWERSLIVAQRWRARGLKLKIGLFVHLRLRKILST